MTETALNFTTSKASISLLHSDTVILIVAFSLMIALAQPGIISWPVLGGFNRPTLSRLDVPSSKTF